MTTWCSRFIGALSISAALAACSGGNGGGSSSGTGGSTTDGTGGGTGGSTTGTPTTAGNGGQGGGTSSSSSSGSTSTTPLTINGKLTANAGNTVPATGDVLIIWDVDGKDGDYEYGYGSGQSMGMSFQLSLDQAPPTQALTGEVLGVGFITLFPTGKKPIGGKIEGKVFKELLGAAENYAVIYKAPNITLKLPAWVDAFPVGYSCAKSVPAKPGETFDTFTPANCSDVTITVDTSGKIKFPNWK